MTEESSAVIEMNSMDSEEKNLNELNPNTKLTDERAADESGSNGQKREEIDFSSWKYYVTSSSACQISSKYFTFLNEHGACQRSYLGPMVTHCLAESCDDPEVSEAWELFEIPSIRVTQFLDAVMNWKSEINVNAQNFNNVVDIAKFYHLHPGQLFSGMTFSTSGVCKSDRICLYTMIKGHGGSFQLGLNPTKVTHLITPNVTGLKYEVSTKSSSSITIVTPDYITDCLRSKQILDSKVYHPRLLSIPGRELIRDPVKRSQGLSGDLSRDPAPTSTSVGLSKFSSLSMSAAVVTMNSKQNVDSSMVRTSVNAPQCSPPAIIHSSSLTSNSGPLLHKHDNVVVPSVNTIPPVTKSTTIESDFEKANRPPSNDSVKESSSEAAGSLNQEQPTAVTLQQQSEVTTVSSTSPLINTSTLEQSSNQSEQISVSSSGNEDNKSIVQETGGLSKPTLPATSEVSESGSKSKGIVGTMDIGNERSVSQNVPTTIQNNPPTNINSVVPTQPTPVSLKGDTGPPVGGTSTMTDVPTISSTTACHTPQTGWVGGANRGKPLISQPTNDSVEVSNSSAMSTMSGVAGPPTKRPLLQQNDSRGVNSGEAPLLMPGNSSSANPPVSDVATPPPAVAQREGGVVNNGNNPPQSIQPYDGGVVDNVHGQGGHPSTMQTSGGGGQGNNVGGPFVGGAQLAPIQQQQQPNMGGGFAGSQNAMAIQQHHQNMLKHQQHQMIQQHISTLNSEQIQAFSRMDPREKQQYLASRGLLLTVNHHPSNAPHHPVSSSPNVVINNGNNGQQQGGGQHPGVMGPRYQTTITLNENQRVMLANIPDHQKGQFLANIQREQQQQQQIMQNQHGGGNPANGTGGGNGPPQQMMLMVPHQPGGRAHNIPQGGNGARLQMQHQGGLGPSPHHHSMGGVLPNNNNNSPQHHQARLMNPQNQQQQAMYAPSSSAPQQIRGILIHPNQNIPVPQGGNNWGTTQSQNSSPVMPNSPAVVSNVGVLQNGPAVVNTSCAGGPPTNVLQQRCGGFVESSVGNNGHGRNATTNTKVALANMINQRNASIVANSQQVTPAASMSDSTNNSSTRQQQYSDQMSNSSIIVVSSCQSTSSATTGGGLVSQGVNSHPNPNQRTPLMSGAGAPVSSTGVGGSGGMFRPPNSNGTTPPTTSGSHLFLISPSSSSGPRCSVGVPQGGVMGQQSNGRDVGVSPPSSYQQQCGPSPWNGQSQTMDRQIRAANPANVVLHQHPNQFQPQSSPQRHQQHAVLVSGGGQPGTASQAVGGLVGSSSMNGRPQFGGPKGFNNYTTKAPAAPNILVGGNVGVAASSSPSPSPQQVGHVVVGGGPTPPTSSSPAMMMVNNNTPGRGIVSAGAHATKVMMNVGPGPQHHPHQVGCGSGHQQAPSGGSGPPPNALHQRPQMPGGTVSQPHSALFHGHECVGGLDFVPQELFLAGCFFHFASDTFSTSDTKLMSPRKRQIFEGFSSPVQKTSMEKHLNFTVEEWKNKILEFGGSVIPDENPSDERITHVLANSQHPMFDTKKVRLVTLYWLRDVMKLKKMIPPALACHFPLPDKYVSGCSNMLVSLSGFEGEEREVIKHMIKNMGARYTGYLTRHVQALVCLTGSGKKFEKSREWKVPAVSMQWLNDSIFAVPSNVNSINVNNPNPNPSSSLPVFNASDVLLNSRYQQFLHDSPTRSSATSPFSSVLTPLELAFVSNLMVPWQKTIKVDREMIEKCRETKKIDFDKNKKEKADTETLKTEEMIAEEAEKVKKEADSDEAEKSDHTSSSSGENVLKRRMSNIEGDVKDMTKINGKIDTSIIEEGSVAKKIKIEKIDDENDQAAIASTNIWSDTLDSEIVEIKKELDDSSIETPDLKKVTTDSSDLKDIKEEENTNTTLEEKENDKSASNNQNCDDKKIALLKSPKFSHYVKRWKKPPCVALTGFPTPEMNKLTSIIEKLGGRLNISPPSVGYSHLVMSRLGPTTKAMCALPHVRYVLRVDWLHASLDAGSFLRERDFTLRDVRFESKFNTSIPRLLSTPNRQKLFEGLTFHLTPSVLPSWSRVRQIIESSGGVVERKGVLHKSISDIRKTATVRYHRGHLSGGSTSSPTSPQASDRPQQTTHSDSLERDSKWSDDGTTSSSPSSHDHDPMSFHYSYIIISCSDDSHLVRDVIKAKLPCLYSIQFVMSSIWSASLNFDGMTLASDHLSWH